jgi:hypothetical protein
VVIYSIPPKATNIDATKAALEDSNADVALTGDDSLIHSAQAGPYRRAAVWEFIGQTFAKAERRAKPKQKKRFRCYAKGIVPVPGISSLSRAVLTNDEEEEIASEDKEVNEEWGTLMMIGGLVKGASDCYEGIQRNRT